MSGAVDLIDDTIESVTGALEDVLPFLEEVGASVTGGLTTEQEEEIKTQAALFEAGKKKREDTAEAERKARIARTQNRSGTILTGTSALGDAPGATALGG